MVAIVKLMTKEIERKAPALYSQEDKGDDAIVYAHWFSPYNGWDWYMTEYDPNERLCFGLVKGFETKWGYWTINELEVVNEHYHFPVIERDLYWEPCTIGSLMD